jgi:hypothetical protein
MNQKTEAKVVDEKESDPEDIGDENVEENDPQDGGNKKKKKKKRNKGN